MERRNHYFCLSLLQCLSSILNLFLITKMFQEFNAIFTILFWIIPVIGRVVSIVRNDDEVIMQVLSLFDLEFVILMFEKEDNQMRINTQLDHLLFRVIPIYILQTYFLFAQNMILEIQLDKIDLSLIYLSYILQIIILSMSISQMVQTFSCISINQYKIILTFVLISCLAQKQDYYGINLVFYYVAFIALKYAIASKLNLSKSLKKDFSKLIGFILNSEWYTLNNSCKNQQYQQAKNKGIIILNNTLQIFLAIFQVLSSNSPLNELSHSEIAQISQEQYVQIASVILILFSIHTFFTQTKQVIFSKFITVRSIEELYKVYQLCSKQPKVQRIPSIFIDIRIEKLKADAYQDSIQNHSYCNKICQYTSLILQYVEPIRANNQGYFYIKNELLYLCQCHTNKMIKEQELISYQSVSLIIVYNTEIEERVQILTKCIIERYLRGYLHNKTTKQLENSCMISQQNCSDQSYIKVYQSAKQLQMQIAAYYKELSQHIQLNPHAVLYDLYDS